MDQLQSEMFDEEVIDSCPLEADIAAIRSDITAIKASLDSCILLLQSDQRHYETAVAYRAPVEHRPKMPFFGR